MRHFQSFEHFIPVFIFAVALLAPCAAFGEAAPSYPTPPHEHPRLFLRSSDIPDLRLLITDVSPGNWTVGLPDGSRKEVRVNEGECVINLAACPQGTYSLSRR